MRMCGNHAIGKPRSRMVDMQRRLFASLYFVVCVSVILLGQERTAEAVPRVPSENAIRSTDALIQKVHGWHCDRRYGWVRHRHGRRWHAHPKWHRHHGACYRRPYYYRPYIYSGRRYYRRRGFYDGPRYRRRGFYNVPRFRGRRFRGVRPFRGRSVGGRGIREPRAGRVHGGRGGRGRR